MGKRHPSPIDCEAPRRQGNFVHGVRLIHFSSSSATLGCMLRKYSITSLKIILLNVGKDMLARTTCIDFCFFWGGGGGNKKRLQTQPPGLVCFLPSCTQFSAQRWRDRRFLLLLEGGLLTVFTEMVEKNPCLSDSFLPHQL